MENKQDPEIQKIQIEDKNISWKKQMDKLKIGYRLLILFLITMIVGIAFLVYKIPSVWETKTILQWVIMLIVFILIENIIFWNGMLRVYFSSVQLGIKWRVVGLCCGMIPIVHLFVLWKIICTSRREVKVENQKIKLNKKRATQKICETKYPILLVHGVFFRDFKYLNYWGRIPEELQKNGATVYYGNHQSAASIADSAEELSHRIKEITEQSGCEKVNIIAHSKGGLDCRYALSNLGIEEQVASLTTINTPHRGCLFADVLLEKIPKRIQKSVAQKYNAALKVLGDSNPDFMAAVTDLTASACEKMNETVNNAENVMYQSVGSQLNHATNGRFPLNFSYRLVKYFDGPNDGLVAKESFSWGEQFMYLTVNGKRGISHGDMIDLNRENIEEFDVREFYVGLVSDLKRRGL